MLNIVLAIHLTLAVLLIVVVLMQRSEGGGLGIGGGGNNGKSASLPKLDGLQRTTWGLGAAFFVTSITLAILAAEQSGSSSLIDQLDGVSASDIAEQSSAETTDAGNSEPETDPAEAETAPALPSDPTAE